MDTVNFIERSKQIHGNKYDYSLSVYTKANDEVLIICPDHGKFSQIASSHYNRGQGCPECGAINRKRKPSDKWTVEVLTPLIKNDRVTIVSLDAKSLTGEFNCSNHGQYTLGLQSVTETSHSGCKGCKQELHWREWFPTFIQRSKSHHGDRYDYSLVEFRGWSENVTIICPVHGEFSQNPKNHAKGHGCNDCGYRWIETKGERKVRETLEAFEIPYKAQYNPPGLKGNKRFDFYIPDLSLYIEYHGKQHYESVDLFGGEEGFEDIQRRDREKAEWLQRRGLPLLEISYREYYAIHTLIKRHVARLYYR